MRLNREPQMCSGARTTAVGPILNSTWELGTVCVGKIRGVSGLAYMYWVVRVEGRGRHEIPINW